MERLKEYAAALGADSKNWWFVNAGDEKATHDYMEKELKFFGIRERTNPSDIDANGLFSHGLAFMMVDRNWQVVGKWPLAEARSAPISPPSGPTHWLFQGPPAESKLLATYIITEAGRQLTCVMMPEEY